MDRNGHFFLTRGASRSRLREAENARINRAEIVKAYSQGKVSRRDLIKWGLIVGGGLLAPIHGLNPFIKSAYADDSGIPTGTPPSPLFGAQPFSQAMPRFDVLPRSPVSILVPVPTAQSNQTQQAVDQALGGGMGPIEGRPPGPVWAHQRFDIFPPKIGVDVSKEGARINNTYNPGVPSSLNSGIDPTQPFHPRLHPNFPDQGPLTLWTFNGTLPPKVLQVRYGEPILFRDHNRLPVEITQNGGFGRHETTTHEHNGHHGAENDGGLWANNPVLVGMIDALEFAPGDQPVEIYSLGTCPRPAGTAIRPTDVHRGLLEWKFGGEAASMAIDAQEAAFDWMAKFLAKHLKRQCDVIRFPSQSVPHSMMQYLDLDDARDEAAQAILQQARTDADMTHSRCTNPKDPDGAKVYSLFASMPERPE